ncbi:hypothetical protein DFH08DRAFT_1036274 [Mycena albidolilacea]|uniref:Uncharacterized protein n=1 Tax=Mycena albidolilacea TaxID=1033008 RepID=A0AAD6ZE16_9AGAR|nr:hypothetical protein DFH08DRAFT_1036274 [Mycena albidolilacea]
MYNTQWNGKKWLYICMFENDSCIEEERVSPGDRETSERGAWSRKVWRGQGRPHRTGATMAGSRSGPARERGNGGGRRVRVQRMGSKQGASCSPEICLAQGVGGCNKRREPGPKVYDRGKCAEARGNFRWGQSGRDTWWVADTLTAGIKVTGLGSGDFVGGLEARGCSFVQNLSHRRGQRSVISGGNRGIQGSESEIEIARTWKNHIAKAPSEGWVQRAGGASVVEEERAMMEDDWQVTNVNNAPFWVHVRAPSIWRESGSSERRRWVAKSGEAHACAAKDAEVMYQHLR